MSSNTHSARPLWRNRDFLFLWSGQVISALGTSVSTFALPLLVLMLTHSPAQAGLVTATREFPYLLLSLPAGALIDRWDRRKVMIRCDLLRWLALGSVPLAFALGYLLLWQLYLVAFIEGTAYVLFSLAQISALPHIVPETQLADAYALDQSTEYVAPLVGPGLGALIISLALVPEQGAALAYLADSLSYIVSTLSLFTIRVPFQTPRSPDHFQSTQKFRGLVQEILEGLRFLWRERRLRLLLLLTTTVNFLQSPLDFVLIVLGQNTLHLDVRLLGLIIGAGGVGGVAGSILAPRLTKRLRPSQLVLISFGTWSLAALVLALAPQPALLMTGRFLVSFIWPTYGVTVVSERLLRTPDTLRGRVNSAFRFLSFGCEPLGKALAGLLLTFLAPQLVLGFIAAAFVLCTSIIGKNIVAKTA